MTDEKKAYPDYNPFRIDPAVMRRDLRSKEYDLCFSVVDGVKYKQAKLGGVDERYIDTEGHTRFFRFEFMESLKGDGIRVLCYIVNTLPAGVDEVVINAGLLSKRWGLKSRNSVYRGISELISQGVIARCSGDRYWVNPAVMFKGPRGKWFMGVKDFDMAHEVETIKPRKL